MTETPYEFTRDWFSAHIAKFEKYVAPLAGSACALLEIGADEGRATTWMTDRVLSHPEAHIDSVDLNVGNVLRRNIEKTGRAAQVSLHEGRSRHILPRLQLCAYDFIYIDGSHYTVDVLEDAVIAFGLAKVGAVIAFDDYLWDAPPFNRFGVPKPAIDAFLSIYAYPSRYQRLVDVLERDWQVWVKKRDDSTRSPPLGRSDSVPPLSIEPFRLGVELPFNRGGSGVRALGGGWSGPEAWGVWSDDKDPTVALALPASAHGPLRLTLRVRGYPPPYAATQPIRVFVGDQPAALWQLGHQKSVETLRLPPVASSQAGSLPVRFEIARPTSPTERDGTDDPRQLGLGLYSMRLDPAPAP